VCTCHVSHMSKLLSNSGIGAAVYSTVNATVNAWAGCCHVKQHQVCMLLLFAGC